MKKIIIIGLLCIFIVGCNNNQQIDIESKLVLDLYESVTPSNDAIVLDNQYKMHNNEFNNEYIIAIGIKNYLTSNNKAEIISKADIEKNIYKIFGKNINFTHTDTYILFDNYCGFNYDKELEQYKSINGCDGSTSDYYFRKPIEAKKEKNKLIITEKLIYVSVDWEKEPHKVTVYNNSIDKSIIKKYDINSDELNINIDDYKSEASTYNYVFEQKNNNYILKKIELIKTN